MGQRTIDPLLAEWLPPLHPSREMGERGEFGPQPLIADGDPDVIVESMGDDWLRVTTWSRGNFEGPEIEGRFDIVQAWMALFMLRERRRSMGRLDDAGLMRVPSSVPAPDGPLSVVVEDLHTALLVEDGVTVARLPDYPIEGGGGPQTPRANVLTHIAFIPLPVLLAQLDLPAGGPGSVFRDWSENWGSGSGRGSSSKNGKQSVCEPPFVTSPGSERSRSCACRGREGREVRRPTAPEKQCVDRLTSRRGRRSVGLIRIALRPPCSGRL